MAATATGRPRARNPRLPLRVVGWASIALGLALVLYGALPLRTAFVVVLRGSADGQDLDGMIVELVARAWADIAGFGLLVLGAILDAAGRRPSREVLDERIRAVLEERERERDLSNGKGPP